MNSSNFTFFCIYFTCKYYISRSIPSNIISG
nr:MAG TPA: hypothetical protein [Caudoviricetes sp.]